jgi:hypothetical protein
MGLDKEATDVVSTFAGRAKIIDEDAVVLEHVFAKVTRQSIDAAAPEFCE